MENLERKAPPYFIGFLVLVILGVLTAVEYYIGTHDSPSVALLAVIALVKAALIVNNYMHVSRLWNVEEEH
jgi:cytochrome c oxidase subunit 4